MRQKRRPRGHELPRRDGGEGPLGSKSAADQSPQRIKVRSGSKSAFESSAAAPAAAAAAAAHINAAVYSDAAAAVASAGAASVLLVLWLLVLRLLVLRLLVLRPPLCLKRESPMDLPPRLGHRSEAEADQRIARERRTEILALKEEVSRASRDLSSAHLAVTEVTASHAKHVTGFRDEARVLEGKSEALSGEVERLREQV